MTISSTNRKAGPYIGNGTASVFSFAFKVFAAADVEVVKLNVSTTIETVLALTTDYTVTLNQDQNANPGGSVTLVAGVLATGFNLVITSDIANLQPTDLTNQGGFYPDVINTALDRATIQIQQLQEGLDRAALLPITSAADSAALVADITRLATSADNLDIDATNIGAINAVSDSISNVNAVAGNATNINTVAGNTSNVNTVATNISSVNTNATNIVAIQGASSNASAAQAAQAAAEAARDQTLAVYDSFDDRYLGSKTSDPTVDNDGNPLVGGALYYNSVSEVMRLYTGTAWVAAYVQGVASSIGFTPVGNISATDVQSAVAEVDSEKLAKASNLSDVTNAATARSNLGAAGLSTAQSFTAAQRGAISALTDGATITPDFSLANNYSVTLGGNRTLANPTNITAGQSGAIVITQDGTGSRTLSYGSYWKFSNGTAPTLTTTANAIDVLAYFVESSTRITARWIGDVK